MNWLRPALWLAVLMSAPVPAAASPVACLTRIEGQDIALVYDSADPILRENRTLRERLFGGYGRITCPGYVTLREMTPDLTDEQRRPFCLLWDDEQDSYGGFEVGDRNAWAECAAPSGAFCRSVNASTETAAEVAGAIGRAAVGAPATGEGASVLDRASGALIATGAGGYISSTLGSATASALALLSAPAVAAGAAVTVVAVGGAVYVCGE